MSTTLRFFSRLYKTTVRACAIAVLLQLGFFLVGLLIEDFVPGMTLRSFMILVLFSLFISYAHEILSVPSWSMTLRRLVHFLTLAVGCFFLMLSTTKAYLIGLLLYSLLYAVITGVSLLIRRLRPLPADSTSQKTEYTSRFS